jgi:5-methylcytosine-specific restriction protein A
MPNLPKKRCRYAGCLNTTRNRFCYEHAALAMKYYDNRRGTSRERGYDADWEKVAEQRRDLDCCLCQPCLKNDNRLTASRTVDHIIPIKARPDLRPDIDNTQVICPACHSRKTLDDLRRYGHAPGTLRRATGASERGSYPDTTEAQGAGGPLFCTT